MAVAAVEKKDPGGGTPSPKDPKTDPSNPGAAGAQPGKDGAGADAGPKKTGTIYDDAGVDEPGAKGSATWPENWREQLAGGDEKKLEALKRYASPDQWANAGWAIRQRVSAGEYKRAAPPENATPEQVKDWRTEQGLPVEPANYNFPLPEGVKIDALDDAAKERIGGFQGVFHKANLTQAQVDQVVSHYNELAVKIVEQEADADADAQDATEDALRADWGTEFRTNLSANESLLKSEFGGKDVPEGLPVGILLARLPEDPSLGPYSGRRLAEVPLFNKFLNKTARAFMIPETMDAGETGGKSVEAQIADIEGIMKTDMNRYIREGLADKYQKLLEIQERRGKLKDPHAVPEEAA